MSKFQRFFTIALLFLLHPTYSQGLELSWRRIGGFHFYRNYQSRPFLDLTHLAIERPFVDRNFSAGLSFIFSKYRPELPDSYIPEVNPKNFYDQTLTIGLFGRFYTKPEKPGLFVEAAVYGNWVHIHQPVVINYGYGIYKKTIDQREYLWSTTLGVGFSHTINKLSYEPYLQLGFSERPGKNRGEQVVIGSVGLLRRSLHTNFIVVPFAWKYHFF